MISKYQKIVPGLSVAKIGVNKFLWEKLSNLRSSDDRAFDRQSKGHGLDTQRSGSVPFFTENFFRFYDPFFSVYNEKNDFIESKKLLFWTTFFDSKKWFIWLKYNLFDSNKVFLDQIKICSNQMNLCLK